MAKMTKLRQAARGKPCMVRLPGCSGNRETTVLAHYRLSGYAGTGLKPPDTMGAWACHQCHGIIDGRIKSDQDQKIIRLAHAEGCMRTTVELEKLGLITVR